MINSPKLILRALPLALAVAGLFPAFAQAVEPAAVDQPAAAAATPEAIETVQIISKRLDSARNGLSPDTGSSVYRFDKKDIAALPMGEDTPMNQVIIRSPGVAEDSFGQLHVRGDHANLQYRINGVVIPDAMSGFGQALDTRFADQINILTGALPAQYGYRTAGIVDIQTKEAGAESGGRVSVMGGSHDDREIGGELSGKKGAFSYFLTGSLLQNKLGIENPTPGRNALHDETRQGKSFGDLAYVIDADSRVSLLFGTSDNKFQIPDRPGLTPAYTLAGAPTLLSQNLNASQRESNNFQILSYQRSVGQDIDYQVSLFHRYTDVNYQPDSQGDLVFNGIAAQILRKNDMSGLQGDLSLHLGTQHTLRTGFFASSERFAVNNNSQVFPADSSGNQTSSAPIGIVDNSQLTGHTYGVYAQDEWKPQNDLTINYGLRYDAVATVVSEGQLSPRLGLVYDLGSKTRVHAGYARYFTPPPTEIIDSTSVQKFLLTTNALPSDANTAVKSERSNYYDLGLIHQLTPQITLGVDGYYRDVRHLQDEGQFGNALIFSAFNYALGRIYGLEFSGSYHQGDFSSYLNTAYSVAQGKGLETGQFNFGQSEIDYINSHWVYLDHDQRWSASSGVAYRMGESTATADLIFGSGLRNGFANTDHLPAHAQVNLGLTRNFATPELGKLDGRISLLNLFDKSYELRDGTGIGVGAPQYGSRRTVYLGMGKSF